jgi:hypothetical protein
MPLTVTPSARAAEAFGQLRYLTPPELPGSAAGAEDALQETWLREVFDLTYDEIAEPVVRAPPRSARSPGTVADRLVKMRAVASLRPAQVNGYPALILRLNGEVDTVISLRIEDSLITGRYAVRNPAKLSHMRRETMLRR